jgi:DNA-binding beta-propeller fold protein YncE
MIAVLDTASRSVVAQVPVGASPHSVAVHPGQPLVANVNYDGDSVSLIDTATESVVGAAPGCRVGCTTIKVGHHPQDLASDLRQPLPVKGCDLAFQ